MLLWDILYDVTDISDNSDTSAWTGGGDKNREGHWEWYDSYTKTYKNIIYMKWGHSEPNSSKIDIYVTWMLKYTCTLDLDKSNS